MCECETVLGVVKVEFLVEKYKFEITNNIPLNLKISLHLGNKKTFAIFSDLVLSLT